MSASVDHETEAGQTKDIQAAVSTEGTAEASGPDTAETSRVDEGNAAPQEQHSDDLPSTPKKAPVCGVCNVNAPKYKCPRCYLPYCSVACNKKHRENHPPDPEPAPNAESKHAVDAQFDRPIQSSDPANPFRALETSDQLRRLFQKYPGLPDQLLQIHAATLPPPEAASQTPGIPASLLKGLPKKETWNHDIGIQNGKEALRKARRADGEEGDAVREYSELILHLINTQDAGSDVTTLLRQQLAQEDTKLIERLMAEEKR